MRNPYKIGIHLVLLLQCTYALYPIFWVWVTALRPTKEIYRDTFGFPRSLSFGNLVKAWTAGKFSQYLLNSVIVTLATVIAVIFISSLAAYALAKIDIKGKNLIFYCFLAGMMVPPQMLIIPLFYLLRDFHVLSTYLALILPYIAVGLPFGILIMRGFFRGIPQSIIDSARIDGCSEYEIYWKIMFPLAKPVLGSLAAFQCLWAWNEFIFALVFIQTERLKTIPLALMHFQGRHTIDIGGVAGAMAIATIPIVIVYLVLQRHFIRGITAGALKE